VSRDLKIDTTRVPIESIGREGGKAASVPDASGEFGAVLRERITGLKFSAHAEDRIRQRGIDISVNELERLGSAVERAAGKNCRDSLVLVDDKAFVVSVKNRTVITALSGSSVKEGVFTNIDSAVVS